MNGFVGLDRENTTAHIEGIQAIYLQLLFLHETKWCGKHSVVI